MNNMKKLILILAFIIPVIGINAQYLLDTEYTYGADTAYMNTFIIKDYISFLSIGVKCTEIGGTSDGYVVLQGSDNGKDFATLNSINYTVYAAQNDTLTVADKAVGLWAVTGLPFNYFRLMCVGTENDTTKYESTFSTKKFK